MFVIGETKGKVINGKLAIPKEFHLRKRIIMGKWRDGNTLYLSDNDKSLNYAAGKVNEFFHVIIDAEDKITIPSEYENRIVEIKGCISTIELDFLKI